MSTKFQNKNEEFLKLTSTNTGDAALNKMNESSYSDLKEQEFHDFVRDIIVCIFIYFFLYALAYFTINLIRKSKETDEYVLDYEDAIADRVSIWLCTFTLATCFGAVLLLPMSIIANEVITIAPQSFYWKWLNSSLLHILWNIIFLFSNVSLFLFLPFAHLFVESIGLPGYKKGIKSRVIETGLILVLLAICMIGVSFIASAVFDYDNAKSQSVLNISSYYLPFLYSCISFIGVLFLWICTPLGFARLFTVVSNLIMKSTFRIDLKEELDAVEFEEQCIQYRIQDLQYKKFEKNNRDCEEKLNSYQQQLEGVEKYKQNLKNLSKRSTVYRNLCYPFIMIFLLLLNTFGVLMVAKNTFFVIFGQLPTTKSSFGENSQKLSESLYTLGILQATFEIALILYFCIASLVGFYNLPFFNKILPKHKLTSMRTIILNCAIFLIFSSALPVSSKILGLTRFDLLGHFGDLHWLSNVNIILIYNFGFAIATGICLITKFTATVRSELCNRVLILFQSAFDYKQPSLFHNNGKNSYSDLPTTAMPASTSITSHQSVSISSNQYTSIADNIQRKLTSFNLFKKHVE